MLRREKKELSKKPFAKPMEIKPKLPRRLGFPPGRFTVSWRNSRSRPRDLRNSLQAVQLDSHWTRAGKQLSEISPAHCLRSTLFSSYQRIAIAVFITCSIIICPSLTLAAYSESAEPSSTSRNLGAISIYSAQDVDSLRHGTLATRDSA